MAYEHQQRHIKRPANDYFQAIKSPSITSTKAGIHTDKHNLTELVEGLCGIMGIKKNYWRAFMPALLDTTFQLNIEDNIVSSYGFRNTSGLVSMAQFSAGIRHMYTCGFLVICNTRP